MIFSINPTLRAVFESELQSGERLLWADRPRRFPLSFITIYGLFFSFIWMLVIVNMFDIDLLSAFHERDLSSDLSENSDNSFPVLFTLIFLGIGLFILVRTLTNFLSPGFDRYALTDRRLLVRTGIRCHKFASFQGNFIRIIERKKSGEIGSLKFLQSQTSPFLAGFGSETKNALSLHHIKNPKETEALIIKTLLGK